MNSAQVSWPSRRPAASAVDALVVEADRRAWRVVCDELVDRFADQYRRAVAERLAQREPPDSRPPTEPRVPAGHAPPEHEAGAVEPSATGEPDSTREGASRATAAPGVPGARGVPGAQESTGVQKPAEAQEPIEAQKPAEAQEPIEAQKSTEAPPADSAWYLYAILRGSDADRLTALSDLEGVEHRPVEIVTADDLAAVAAQVPLAAFETYGDEPDLSPEGWLHQAVRAHEGVVEYVCAKATGLPVRFSALYPSRDHVRAVLHARSDPLRAELDRLDETAEWGVRVRAPAPPSPEELPEDADVPCGRDWMLRRRETAAARERSRRAQAEVASEVAASLARYAREHLVRVAARPGDPPGLVLDAVYLVARSLERGFRTTLDDLSARHAAEGMRFELTGPWPPYHFVHMPPDGGLSMSVPAPSAQEVPR